MWFKNLVVYRLPAGCSIKADDLERKPAHQALQPCGGLQMESRGWLCPYEEGLFLCQQRRQWLLALGSEQKLLPASVIRQEAQDRAEAIERQQGHAVGRKQMREIKERVTEELLPRALSRRRTTHGWIDSANGWLAVDAAVDAKAAQFMEALRRADFEAPTVRLETQRSPASAMADWLVRGEAPGLFGQVKRLTFLDILRQEAGVEEQEKHEQFEIDFALMTGELALMLADLAKALGGEKETA